MQKLEFYITKPTLTVEEEVYLHDLNNLGADIGGFFGIFLGISCLNIFDIIHGFLKRKSAKGRGKNRLLDKAEARRKHDRYMKNRLQ